MPVPFALRRPVLLLRDLLVDRDQPDLRRLGRIRDAERFVWAILPHAARTFSACIALLPAEAARASAVAYLYCRILDTYEDLLPTVGTRVEALTAFGERFTRRRAVAPAGAHPDERPGLAPAPAIEQHLARDPRDRAHLLLVGRCSLVDRLYLELPMPVQRVIAQLVGDMAEGMVWGARTFAAQDGVLTSTEQLLRYCRAVLGNPVLFVARLVRVLREGRADLTPAEEQAALRAGEFVQLANITRDVEKDLARSVAFHPLLADDVGTVVPSSGETALDEGEEALLARVAEARGQLLDLALHRAPSWAELMAILDPGGRFSLVRASAALMLLFTERHYLGCAARLGRTVGPRRPGGARLVLSSLPTMISPVRSARLVQECLSQLAAASEPEPAW